MKEFVVSAVVQFVSLELQINKENAGTSEELD